MISIKEISGIKLDNDYYYFSEVRAVVAHSDSSACITFHSNDNIVTCHVAPSDGQFKQDIINSLLVLNRLMGLKIIFSKSLKLSTTISFTVNF